MCGGSGSQAQAVIQRMNMAGVGVVYAASVAVTFHVLFEFGSVPNLIAFIAVSLAHVFAVGL